MQIKPMTRLILGLGMTVLAGCTVTGQDETLRPLRSAGPDYPAAAERDARTGWAGLDCTITAAGTTQDCTVTDASAPDFAASALHFVQQARYSPARHNGVAVEQRHHRFRINYSLPARTITLDAVCSVRASGEVRNCRAPDGNTASAQWQAAQWQAARTMLERLTMTALVRNGKPADDPDRAIGITEIIAPLPLLEPMPTLPGDIVRYSVLTCHLASGGRQACVVERSGSDKAEAAGTSRYQLEVAITGVAPPPTGDFSQ